MKNATTFILYKIVTGSLWERQLANKPAAFSLDQKSATNTVNLAPQPTLTPPKLNKSANPAL